jgi:hypothetical protein
MQNKDLTLTERQRLQGTQEIDAGIGRRIGCGKFGFPMGCLLP